MLEFRFSRNYLLLMVIAISNGMVPLLIGSTLFVWLKEQGINIASIGLFGLANLPWALSFIISAVLEYFSYKKYFHYKYVLMIALLVIATTIYHLPQQIGNPGSLFKFCLLISFASSIARVIMLALQKTLFNDQALPLVINISTISYKIGILFAGSLALYFSQTINWSTIYHSFALIFLFSVALIGLFPKRALDINHNQSQLKQSLATRLIAPFKGLYQMPHIVLILLLMFCYRAPDNLITNYFDLFYLHFGLSKTNVAFGYKFYGMVVASLGGLLCIKLNRRYSYYSNLTLALSLHLISYLLIYWFSNYQAPLWAFYLCVTLEELTRGMTMIIFWSFQTHICTRQHILVQLALLTAVDSLSYSLLGSVGGIAIHWLGYGNFVLLVLAGFIPAFIVLSKLRKTVLL